MQKLDIIQSKAFKKSYKKYKNNKQVLLELEKVLNILQCNQPLPTKYKDHGLKGSHRGIRECHIKPDDLLLYYIADDKGILKLYDIGSHADIFK